MSPRSGHIEKALEAIAIGGAAYKARHPDAGWFELAEIQWAATLAYLTARKGRADSEVTREDVANELMKWRLTI